MWWWWVGGHLDSEFSVSFGPNLRFRLWIWTWTKLNKNLYTTKKLLVRAECVHQRNEVAIKLGIIFLSLLFPTVYSNWHKGVA